MKIKLLVLAIAVCMIATPARADLFDISVINPNTVYSAGIFTASADAATPGLQAGIVIGQAAPATSTGTTFNWGLFSPTLPLDAGSFLLTMTLSNIDNTLMTADATGSLIFTDVDGDTITSDLLGKWERSGSSNDFSGLLSNTYYNATGGGGTFDGGSGSVPMGFSSPLPWNGSIVQLTAQADWFGSGAFNVTGGSIDITVVPVPAAVLLGMLGLGVAGLKLRKFA